MVTDGCARQANYAARTSLEDRKAVHNRSDQGTFDVIYFIAEKPAIFLVDKYEARTRSPRRRTTRGEGAHPKSPEERRLNQTSREGKALPATIPTISYDCATYWPR